MAVTGGKGMIHQFKLNGYHIVLDVCSGAVHVVDELAYEMIAHFEAMNPEFAYTFFTAIERTFPEQRDLKDFLKKNKEV